MSDYSGGFFIESEQLPNWISWFKYVSFIYYGYNAMASLQFPRDSVDIVVQSVREQAGFNNLSYWQNVAAVVGLILPTKFLGYIFLKYLRGPKFLKL